MSENKLVKEKPSVLENTGEQLNFYWWWEFLWISEIWGFREIIWLWKRHWLGKHACFCKSVCFKDFSSFSKLFRLNEIQWIWELFRLKEIRRFRKFNWIRKVLCLCRCLCLYISMNDCFIRSSNWLVFQVIDYIVIQRCNHQSGNCVLAEDHLCVQYHCNSLLLYNVPFVLIRPNCYQQFSSQLLPLNK